MYTITDKTNTRTGFGLQGLIILCLQAPATNNRLVPYASPTLATEHSMAYISCS